MSREDYVAIAVRLFAMYVGIKSIVQIPFSVQALLHADGMGVAWLFVLVMLAVVGICAALWFFPLTIARKLLPVMKEPRSESAIDASVGLSLGLTLIGTWFLGQGLLDAVYWLTLILRAQQMDQPYAAWDPEQVASMAVTAFELVIGAWLVLGSAGFRRLIHRFRYGTA